MFARIDNWRRSQSDLPNRQTAIRRLLDIVLTEIETNVDIWYDGND
jgi:hypothetical protein